MKKDSKKLQKGKIEIKNFFHFIILGFCNADRERRFAAIKKNKIYNRGLFKDDFSREEWHHKYIDGKHGELDKNDQGQRMPNYTCTTQQIQSSDCESMCNNMDSCTMYILEGNECKLRVCDYL